LGRPTTWLVRSKSLTTLDFFNKEYVTNTAHADTIHGIHHLGQTIYGAAAAATATLDTPNHTWEKK